VVLSLTETVPFYAQFGATRRTLKGWKLEPNLVGLNLSSAHVLEFAERIDEHEEGEAEEA
jgi:hypothetical protein